jgi:hypothetical protein
MVAPVHLDDIRPWGRRIVAPDAEPLLLRCSAFEAYPRASFRQPSVRRYHPACTGDAGIGFDTVGSETADPLAPAKLDAYRDRPTVEGIVER